MAPTPDSFSRYLPADQQAREWGWRLIDAGRQKALPGTGYPAQKHPQNYLFDTDGRRTLDEYQIVIISEGQGVFESAYTSEAKIQAGTAILLYPGVWHRYAPSKECGWTEYWLGFGGREADRIMQTFFSPEEPIIHIGQPDALILHCQQVLHWLRQSVAAKEQVLASHLPLALSLLRSSQLTSEVSYNSDSQLVMQAKAHMLQNLNHRSDLSNLAAELGVSYSRLRFTFKKLTGYSPREYENTMKLNRACDLLRRERKSVSETADALGYSSVYYFSRAFKKRFNLSPQQWLKEKTQ